MNKTYRVVYNETTHTYTAVAEIATARGKSDRSAVVGEAARPRKTAAKLFALAAVPLALLSISQPALAYVAIDTMNSSYAYNSGTATVTENSAISIGSNSSANGTSAISIGTNSSVNGESSIAMGKGTQASSNLSVSIGPGSKTKSTYTGTGGPEGQSVAIGVNAAASSSSVAMGGYSVAGGQREDIERKESVVTLTSGITQATALGYGAYVSASQSTAIGADTRATAAASVAIGGDDVDDVSRMNRDGSITARTAVNGGYVNTEFKKISGRDLVNLANQYQATTSSGGGSVAIGTQAVSSGHLSTAIGTGSKAAGLASTALGVTASAQGLGSFAGGPNAEAIGDKSIAFGGDSTANGVDTTAVGSKSKATGEGANAIGTEANAGGVKSTAVGYHAVTTANNANAVGTQATASGAYSNAVGYDAQAKELSATAVGKDAYAGRLGDLALGKGTVAFGTHNTDGIYASKYNESNLPTKDTDTLSDPDFAPAVAQGTFAQAVGRNTLAIGNNATSGDANALISRNGTNKVLSVTTSGTVSNSIAIGGYTQAIEDDTTALGFTAKATGDGANALGTRTTASGAYSNAVGYDSQAIGLSATAVGKDAYAQSAGDLAVGKGTVAVGFYDKTTLNEKNLPTPETTESQFAPSVAQGTFAQAIGHNALALGNHAVSGDEDAVISRETGNRVTSVTSNKTVQNSIAIGGYSRAVADDSTAVGYISRAAGEGSNALGTASNALAQHATAVGYNAYSIGLGSNALGTNSAATGAYANAVGYDSQAVSLSATAMGKDAYAQNAGDLALGKGAVAVGYASAAFDETNLPKTGDITDGDLASATAQGVFAQAVGKNALAIGNNAKAGNINAAPERTETNKILDVKNDTTDVESAIAIGTETEASANKTVAMGYKAKAGGEQAIAIGDTAVASGLQSISIGTGNKVSGAHSGAFGDPSVIDAENSYSVGNNNTLASTQNNVFALGNNITNTGSNSVFLGSNSALGSVATVTGGINGTVSNATLRNGVTYGTFAGATSDGVVSVGDAGKERRIQNVAAGLISATSTDAINGSQLYAVADTVSKGWDLQGDGVTKDAVVPGDTVNFTNGTGTTASVESANGVSTVKYSVDTTTLDTSTAGAVSAADKGTKFATANDVANAINLATERTEKTSVVEAGDNVAVASVVNGNQTTYTVSATDKSASVSVSDALTVSPKTETKVGKTDVTEYALDLSDKTKTSLTKADTAMQSFNTTVNGQNSTTVKDGGTVNFADGTGTTARADGSTIIFDVNKATLTTTDGTVKSSTNGDTFATATDVANAINDSEKTTTVVNGSNTHVSSTVAGNNTEYTVSADKATVTQGDGVTITSKATTDANQAVTTDYTVALSDKTKEDIQKGVDANDAVTNKGLTFTGDSGSSDVQKLGETLAVNGDKNITTEAAGDTLTIKLNDNISVNSVTAQTITGNNITANNSFTAGPLTVNNNTISAGNTVITNVASGGTTETNAANIGDVKKAAAAAKSTVAAGTNVANVVETKDAADGHSIYTVNADGAKVSSADASKITVNAGQKDGNNVTDYAVDLSQAAKESLAKADTALQSFTTAVNGATVDTINKDSTVINFVDGNGTTARNAGNEITFDVKKATLTTNPDGKVESSQTGDTFATATDVAKAINDSEKTSVVTAGDNVKVTPTVNGNETTYQVSAVDKSASVSVSNALKMTKGAETKDGTTDVTDYALDLSDTTKDDIKKGVDANNTVTTEGLTFTGDNNSTSNEKKLGETLAVNGDSNITTAAVGDSITIKLNDDITVNSVTAKTVTGDTINGKDITATNSFKAGPLTVSNNTISAGDTVITNVASGGDVNSNAANIGDVKKAKTEVEKGTNVASVTSKEGSDGQTIYTVNAQGAKVSAGSDAVAVAAQPEADNMTNYSVDLSQKSKDSLAKADTAVQSFTTSVNGTAAETINDKGDINFVNGNGTTARNANGDITFDVKTATLSTNDAGDVVSDNTGDTYANATNIAEVINKAVTTNTRTTSVAAGSNTHVSNKVEGNNTEYTVSADKATVAADEGVSVTSADTTDDKGAVTTAYTVKLSDQTKADIKKGVDANDAVTNKGLTFTGDSGTSNEKKLGETLAVNGDKNITTEAAGDAITIKLKDDITVNTVKAGDVNATNITGDNITATNFTAGPVTINQNGINAGDTVITNVKSGGDVDTNAANIGDVKKAAAAAKSEVAKGTNVASVTSTEGSNGQTIYTVNAEGTTVSAAAGAKVTVKEGARDAATNDVNYEIDLSDDAKTSLDKANTAMQSFTTSVNGSNAVTVANGGNINFVNGNGTTAEAKADGITFNIKEATLTAKDGKVRSDKAGDTFATATDVANAINNAGFTAKANGDAGELINAGDEVNFINGSNIDITRNGSNFTVATKKDLVVDSVKAGDTTVNSDGIKIDNADDDKQPVSLTKDGLDNGGNQITNVKSGGDVDTNAANIGDIKKAAAAATTKVEAGDDNVKVEPEDNADGSKTYKVKLADDLKANSLTTGDTTVNSDGIKIGDNTLTNAPVTVNGNRVTNINDAINQTAAQAFSPLTFAGDSGNNVERKLGSTLNLRGGATGNLTEGNIAVVADGTDTLNLKLAQNVKLGDKGSVNAGDTTVNSDGIKIDKGNSGNNPVTLNKDGLDNGGNQIKNVASGGNVDTNAANIGDVKKAVAAAAAEVVAGTNVADVTTSTGNNGQTVYTVNAKGAKASAGSDAVTVTPSEKADNVTDYAVDLSDKTKASLAKADSAMQNVVTQIDGNDVKTLSKDDNNANFISGENIVLSAENGGIKVATAKDLKADSLTTGDTTVNNDGVKIGDKVSLTKDGLDNGGNRIKNVAAGTEDGDAVNVKQLKDAAAAAKTEVKQGKNVVVTEGKGDNGQTVYTVATADDLDVNSVKAGDTTVNNEGVKVGDKVSVNKDGIKAGDVSLTDKGLDNAGNKITNVAEGTDDGDAVNVKQLKNSAAAAKTEVKQGDNIVVTEGKGTNGQTVYTVATAKDLNVNSVKAGDVNLSAKGLDNAGNKVTNVADGDVSATSKDAVNGSQLHQTNQNVAANKAAIDKGINFGDGKTANNYALGDTLNVKGDANVTSTTVNGGVQLGLADNLSIGKTHPVTINGNTGNIGGLSNKTWNPDSIVSGQAATEDQLKQAVTTLKTEVKQGDNIVVTEDKGKNGQSIYTVSTAKDLKVDSVKAGNTTLDKEGIKIAAPTRNNPNNTVSVTPIGLNNGGNTITNVAPGKNGTDAVNVNQLTGMGNALQNQINNVGKKAYAGVAGAIAQSSIPQVTRPGATGLGVGGGYYGGESAMAIGVSSMSDGGNWIIKGNFSTNTGGHVGVGAGALYQW